MNNHHEEHEKENSERWLLTYSDLITLLLAFFIILYSMANVDKAKFERLMKALGSQFGAGGNAGIGQTSGLNTDDGADGVGLTLPPLNSDSLDVTLSPSATPPGVGNALEIEKMQAVKNEVEDMLNLANLGKDVKVTLTERGLEISINAEVLFDTGQADLKPAYVPTVERIASVLTQLKNNQILVEGHTDNMPINTSQFPSNWYLSTARATRVLGLLMGNNQLDPGKLSVVGYGEFRPIASNDTPEGRAKNRRVTIVILKNALTSAIDISTLPPSGPSDSPAPSAAPTPAAAQTPSVAASSQN